MFILLSIFSVSSRILQGSRWLLRISVRTCGRKHPGCVPTERTGLRTCCAQFAQLLRILDEPSLSLEHLQAAGPSREPVREYAV